MKQLKIFESKTKEYLIIMIQKNKGIVLIKFLQIPIYPKLSLKIISPKFLQENFSFLNLGKRSLTLGTLNAPCRGLYFVETFLSSIFNCPREVSFFLRFKQSHLQVWEEKNIKIINFFKK